MEEKRHDVDAAEAARALGSIDTTRHQVAARVGSPPHYYTKLGASMAVICLAQPLATPAKLVLTVVAFALLLWAIRSYSAATGTWTMATLREPGAWMAWLMIGVMLAAVTASMAVQTWVACIPAAVAALAVTSYLGPRWDAAWVRSLTAEGTR